MTYALLSVAVLVPLAAITAPTLRRLGWRSLALAGLALVALTAVFDNVIIGLGIVDYDPALILGWKLGLAPLEDFSYTLGAVLLVPAVWTWLSRLERPRVEPSPTHEPSRTREPRPGSEEAP